MGLKSGRSWNKYFGWLNWIAQCSLTKFIGPWESLDMVPQLSRPLTSITIGIRINNCLKFRPVLIIIIIQPIIFELVPYDMLD